MTSLLAKQVRVTTGQNFGEYYVSVNGTSVFSSFDGTAVEEAARILRERAEDFLEVLVSQLGKKALEILSGH
mgnify:CR=1 FL=1